MFLSMKDAMEVVPMTYGVLRILNLRAPLEVVQIVVLRIPVKVTTLHTWRTRTYKSLKYELMHAPANVFTVLP